MALPVDPIAAIVTLVQGANKIRETYQMYAHANKDLSKLDSQLDVALFVLQKFQQIITSGESNLSDSDRQRIARLMDHLQGIYDRLEKQMSRFPTDAKFDVVGRLRWTFGGKSGYEALLQEMDKWQERLHRVIEILKFLQPREEWKATKEGEDEAKSEMQALYKRLFEIGGDGARHADAMDDVVHGRIDAKSPEVDMRILSLVSEDGDRKIVRLENSQIVYVEFRYDTEEIRLDIQKLASVLGHADAASMHILQCIGTAYQEQLSRSALLYNIPNKPTQGGKWTLAQAIEDSKTVKPSLEVRVRYAVEICMAVMFTHAGGLVHKSICPDNILLLPTNEHSNGNLSAFLVGFDAARLRDLSAYSKQLAETDPIKKLYHHPERQIALQDGHVVRYGIRHDMYSLGVVLLELAVWKPLRRINKDLRSLSNTQSENFNSTKLREKLLEETRKTLAAETGPKYTGAVACCLENPVLQDERETRELFYEQVLLQIQQIVV